MSSLVELLLALAIRSAPPGRSPYSLEVVPECGRDPAAATCELRPVCEHLGPLCAPPRYSKFHSGWVRVESAEGGVRRYASIVGALARTADWLVHCDPKKSVCPEHDWPGSTHELAVSGLTVALHESGLREDVEVGRGPLGRGPAGEVCLVQVAVDEAPKYAGWIGADEREALLQDPARREDFARGLLGESPKALEHCFEVGLRMLIRARAACATAPVPWDHGMFAMYGSGRTCRLPGVADRRQRTFRALLAAKPELSAEHAKVLDAARGIAQSDGDELEDAPDRAAQ